MKYALTNCTVLDGTEHMTPRPRAAVLVENDRIAGICGMDEIPTGYGRVDLGGRYLMPGLINLHVHLPGNGAPRTGQQKPALVQLLMANPVSRAVVRKMCENYAKMELLSGVTTIRTVGGLGHIDTDIRDGIRSGRLTGPRILAANMAVSVPGGHMAGVLAYCAESEEDCRAFVRRIAEDHPDLIKLMITGGVLDAAVMGEPGVLRMSYELAKAACDEAHALGYPVAAHVESAEGVRTALRAGVDTIEHGAAMDEELLSLFRERGASEICTISPALPLANFDPAVSHSTELTRCNGAIVREGIILGAKQALANGIPVGLGNDTACPFVTHYDFWRELCYFEKFCGVSRAFALHTATLRNAQIARIDGETGSIAPGKCADLLATDGDPLADLRALRTPYLVVKSGRRIQQPKIKKLESVERELDKML